MPWLPRAPSPRKKALACVFYSSPRDPSPLRWEIKHQLPMVVTHVVTLGRTFSCRFTFLLPVFLGNISQIRSWDLNSCLPLGKPQWTQFN